MKKLAYITLTVLTFTVAKGQVPSPGANQIKPILYVNGMAHIGDGSVIENSAVGFSNGKLDFVGKADDTTLDRSKYEVIDINGKHVYPGFILPNSNLGLIEVSAVDATRDHSEIGNINPNVRAIAAYNTDSELIPTMRFNGILTVQIAPKGGNISGTSSIVQLDAWNWEDAIIKADDGIHMNWPAKMLNPRWWLGEKEKRANKNYDKTVEKLNKVFNDAKAYAESNNASKNIKLEAMKGLFDGTKQLFVHENKAKDIIASIQFAQKLGVQKIVLVGGNDALYVKDFLKENDVSIILSNVHRLPSRKEEDIDMPYKLPYLLNQAGIKYCLGYQSGVSSARNLGFFAGTTAAYGLDKELALKSITLDAAQILGIDEVLGSLAVGKNATLFVSEGDALDMRTNKTTYVYVEGRKVELEAMQQRLYKKYQAKYAQD